MRLALGTAQFGLPYGVANKLGQVSRIVATNMLQLAIDSRIDTLDTAIAYGESESCLGNVGVQGFNLITKIPSIPEHGERIGEWIHQQLLASMTRLGVKSIYGLLLHRPSQLLSSHGLQIFSALQELKRDGLVQKIGVSIYSPSELDILIARYNIDIVQAPFSLIDRRLFTSGWLGRLKKKRIEVHTRSVFLQGLLLMPRSDIPTKFSPWDQLWSTWHDWLEYRQLTPLQASLAYALAFSEVDRVVVGAESCEQLIQIINASSRDKIDRFPDISSDDEGLINPANWTKL
jgi:aryl-alcohol dehydrogenase-like predicted oxidoreductase